MKKNMIILCLASAALGMLFSILTMQTNDGPEQERQVVVIEVIERRADYAYVVRTPEDDKRRVYYSQKKVDLPMFTPTTIVVNEREILRP